MIHDKLCEIDNEPYKDTGINYCNDISRPARQQP